MNMRVRENPWRLMLAVNAAVLTGVFLYKITREPYVPYIHLLVDYHFGFTKRADRRGGIAVFRKSAGVAGVRAFERRLADHARALHKAVSENFWFRRCAHAAVRVHGRLAVLSEKFHAYARAFRHLRLCICDLPAAGAGALDFFRAARSSCFDDPDSDPPHPSPDVYTDDRGHRGVALLSRARF